MLGAAAGCSAVIPYCPAASPFVKCCCVEGIGDGGGVAAGGADGGDGRVMAGGGGGFAEEGIDDELCCCDDCEALGTAPSLPKTSTGLKYAAAMDGNPSSRTQIPREDAKRVRMMVVDIIIVVSYHKNKYLPIPPLHRA